MSEYVKVVESCLREAPHDEGAVRILRNILASAAERAPAEALVEIVRTVLAIRERDMQVQLECN
jgi:hypothetical protein